MKYIKYKLRKIDGKDGLYVPNIDGIDGGYILDQSGYIYGKVPDDVVGIDSSVTEITGLEFNNLYKKNRLTDCINRLNSIKNDMVDIIDLTTDISNIISKIKSIDKKYKMND